MSCINTAERFVIVWIGMCRSRNYDSTYYNKQKQKGMNDRQFNNSSHHNSLRRQYVPDYTTLPLQQTALRQVQSDSLQYQTQHQLPHEYYFQGLRQQGTLQKRTPSHIDQIPRSANQQYLQAPFLPVAKLEPTTFTVNPNISASDAQKKDASNHHHTTKLNRTIVNELIDPDHQEDVMDRIEVQNNIVENLNETPNYEQEYVVPAEELDDIRQKHGSDIFHCMAPDFRLEDIFEMRHYRLVRGGSAASVYSLDSVDSNHRTLKLVMELPHSREKVLAALIDPANYHLWNEQVDFGNIKLRIYSENTVIAYQKHRAFDNHFRERDFLYIRHLFQKSGVIYMADKSIEHASFPPFDDIIRGDIKYGIWAFEELSSSSTRVICLLHMNLGGTLGGNKSAESMIKYLESMARLSGYLSRNGRIIMKIQDYFDSNWGTVARANIVSIPNLKEFQEKVSFDCNEEMYLTAFPKVDWHNDALDQFFTSQMSERHHIQPAYSSYSNNQQFMHNEVFDELQYRKQMPAPCERPSQWNCDSNETHMSHNHAQTPLSKGLSQNNPMTMVNCQTAHPPDTGRYLMRQADVSETIVNHLEGAKQSTLKPLRLGPPVQIYANKSKTNQWFVEASPASIQNPRTIGIKPPFQSPMQVQQLSVVSFGETNEVNNSLPIRPAKTRQQGHNHDGDYKRSNTEQNNIVIDVTIKLDANGLVILPQDYLKMRHKLSPVKSKYRLIQRPGWKNYFLKDRWQYLATGELRCIDAKLLKEQRGVLSYILKRIPNEIISGKNIMNISLPAVIFSQWSYLQILARSFGSAPLFLERAAAEDSDIQRIKLVSVFLMGYSSILTEMRKPFNPILGETYQGWLNGCPIYCEQISHHPPVSSVLMVGRGYRFFCMFEPKIHMGFNRAQMVNEGQLTVQFDRFPKNAIHCQVMDSEILGVLIGDRLFQSGGKSHIYDDEGHFLELNFNPTKKGIFSFGKQSKPADWVEGTLSKTSPAFIVKFRKDKKRQGPSKKDISQALSVASGRWYESIKFDGVEYYNMQRDQPCDLEDEPYPLNSNCGYREDIVYRRKQDIARAQIEKERLEVIQRNDKKLRDKHGKTH